MFFPLRSTPSVGGPPIAGVSKTYPGTEEFIAGGTENGFKSVDSRYANYFDYKP